MQITLLAHAKINLSLDLTGRLPDGYHAIRTVMQSVDLADTLTIAVGGPGLRLVCGAPGVPTDERNTAVKAAALFYSAVGKDPEATITLTKKIPSQAGLGGGSADAAAVLTGLNALYGEPLPQAALQTLALQVGADVPFCRLGGTRLCLNKGEVTAALPDFSAYAVLAKPDAGISTAAAYKRFDGGAALAHPDDDALTFYFAQGDYKTGLRYARNVFEQLGDLPEGKTIRRLLEEAGAYYAAMSGSGSAFFGLFDTADAAGKAAGALADAGFFAAACRTVPTGVAVL